MSFADLYANAARDCGGCPIEAGTLGKLADNECPHDRLPGDPTPPCGCWPQEQAVVLELPRGQQHDDRLDEGVAA